MTPALLGPGVLVVGTDTGVGKTAVSCALLRLAVRLGRRPVPFKPVETGCLPDPTDAMSLLTASGRTDLGVNEVCPFQFSRPVAPALAAEGSHLRLSLPALLAPAAALARRGDFLLVETAGGLLSPYTTQLTGADLAAALALPVLLVGRNALGTINHCALALSELRHRALPLAGLVLSAVSPGPSPDRSHNARLIEELTGVRPLADLPFFPDHSPDLIADELARQVDPLALFARFGL